MKKFLIATALVLSVNLPVFSGQLEFIKIAEPEIENSETTVKTEDFGFSSAGYKSGDFSEYDERDSDLEDNSVVLKINPKKNKPAGKIFKLSTEKSYTPGRIDSFNAYWIDDDNIRTSEFRKRYMPSIMFSQGYEIEVDADTKVSLGQASLAWPGSWRIGVIEDYSSDYDSGMRIESKIKGGTLYTGAYSSSLSNEMSGGLVFVGDEIKIANGKGGISSGAAVYTNGANTQSIFTQIRYKRFSTGIQAAAIQDYGKNSGELYFYPKYRLTNSLSLNGKFACAGKYSQVGFSYKPVKNNDRDFTISVDAALYDAADEHKQKVKFTTRFKI